MLSSTPLCIEEELALAYDQLPKDVDPSPFVFNFLGFKHLVIPQAIDDELIELVIFPVAFISMDDIPSVSVVVER